MHAALLTIIPEYIYKAKLLVSMEEACGINVSR